MAPEELFSYPIFTFTCVDPDPQSSWTRIQYGSGSATLRNSNQKYSILPNMRADREAAPSLVIHQGLHHQLNNLPQIAIVSANIE